MADNIYILRPAGRLDGASGPAFEGEVEQALAASAERLLLDMAAISYISSAGLRTILQAAKKVKARGGRLALCALSAPIMEVFEISGFANILDISPTQEEAMSKLAV